MNTKEYNQLYRRLNNHEIPVGRTWNDPLQGYQSLFTKLELTQIDILDIVDEITLNLEFFKQRFWNSAYTLSNFIDVVIQARYAVRKNPNVTPNKLRQRYIREYKQHLESLNS